MTRLSIYTEDCLPLSDNYINTHGEITQQLSEIGVLLEHWDASISLPEDATSEKVLTAYQEDIERINKSYGFQSVDVVSLYPEHPQRVEFREKFLAEHTHSDFEIRFFVAGQAMFYLHVGARVYLVLCEAGDLISVPANTTHWFDMGEKPSFTAIRFFTTPEGWVANFTESGIAAKFPTLEEYLKLSQLGDK